jgi:hypothetical protein
MQKKRPDRTEPNKIKQNKTNHCANNNFAHVNIQILLWHAYRAFDSGPCTTRFCGER